MRPCAPVRGCRARMYSWSARSRFDRRDPASYSPSARIPAREDWSLLCTRATESPQTRAHHAPRTLPEDLPIHMSTQPSALSSSGKTTEPLAGGAGIASPHSSKPCIGAGDFEAKKVKSSEARSSRAVQRDNVVIDIGGKSRRHHRSRRIHRTCAGAHDRQARRSGGRLHREPRKRRRSRHAFQGEGRQDEGPAG